MIFSYNPFDNFGLLGQHIELDLILWAKNIEARGDASCSADCAT